MNMQAVKARKITEPVLVLRTAANHPSITNDLAAVWSNFGETKNMLQKVEDKTNTVSSPPRLVHLHKQSNKGKTVQFSRNAKHSPKKEKLQANDVSPDSSTHGNDVIDGDYLNNEMCVLNANMQDGITGATNNVKGQSSPLDMEPLRSGSSSREDEPRTSVPYQPVTTLHSNKGAIFGPPINFDKVTSATSDQSSVVTSAPSVTPVTVQPVSHHVPLRKFQIPESALVSLKKTIEKQKIDVQASGIKLESVTSKMEPLVADSTEESSVVSHNKAVRRKLHQTYDPVVATNAATSGNCSKKRKIAVAPSPLNYVQAPLVKNNFKQPRSTATSKEQPSIKTHQQKSKPTVRKIAMPSEQAYQRKRPNQTAAITPSSWRAGKEVVHKVLGPPKKPTRPPKQPQDYDLTAGDSSSSLASSTGSVGLAVRSKQLKSSPSKESTQIPLLNANAAAVLSELGLSEENSYPPPKSSVRPKKPPSLGTQQSVPRVFNPEPPLISRIRHYDAEKVREYMERKREARKKRDMDQRYAMQRTEMEKIKKLESLDEGRRQALQNNLRKAEMKRQQQLFQELNQQPGIHIHLEEANPDSDKENWLQSSPPAKKQRGVLSSHLLTSSSLLDTLAMSGSKKTTPLQQSPPSQTLSESVSNQQPIASIPTAQSLRTTSPIGKMQEPDLPSSMDSVSKTVITSDFPSQGNLPDPVVITKSKVPQKSKSADALTTSHKTVKSSKRPHVAKLPSTTFNTRDLPGIHNVDAHVFKAAQQRRQEEAVKRIQAAYRGHQVRKSLQWNVCSAGPHQKKHTSSHPTTTATMISKLKSTPVVKSKKPAKKTVLPQQVKSASVKKVATPVTDKVTHKTLLEVDNSGGYNSGPTAAAVPPWEQTGGDDMSVINIYTRRYEKLQEQISATAALHAERCKEAFSSSSLTSGSQPSVTGKPTSLLKQVQEEGTHMEYTPLYSESFEVASDDHEVASATAPGVSDVASRSKSQRVDTVNVVTASTLSERSFDPDSLQDPAEQSGTASTNSLSCISLINEGDEATTDVDQYSQTASVVQKSPHKSDSHKGGKTAKTHLQTDTQPPLKYSPDSLGLKLNAELALLESVSDSLQQLNNVEGARAISTAQQETVGLAHVLKTRQKAHELEMKTMAQKAHDEVLQAKQQLQQMQQSAAEKFELLTKQTLYQSMEQQKKINQIQREAEEAQRMLSVHTGTLHHTATQTATPQASVKTNAMASSVVTEGSGLSTSNISSQDKESSDNQTSLTTSSIPTYISDFEDNTVATPTNATLGVSMATAVGSGDPHTVKSDTKKDVVAMATDHVSEDLSSEGDTLVDHNNSSQLDSTLQNAVDSAIMDSGEDDGDGVSFRMVLPSESHRKQSRDRLRSASESVSSLATSHGDLSALEPHGSSDGEESFCDFVSRMVRQYMVEEETRAQHQQALLKLREQALQEKNKLELQWLTIKQRKLRNKGADDKMPPLKKKQREIMRKFQHEQAEIQRLQEASKQASQERKMLLKQQEDINKIRKSSEAYKDKLRQLMRGHQDVSLSSVSSVPAPTSDSSDSSPATGASKKNISEPPAEIPSTSTPSSAHKIAKQLSLTEHSIREDISEQQLHRSGSSRPIKTVTSFPTYSPLDTQEVLSVSGISTDREDEGKYSSVHEEHTSTDKDIGTSTDSIPKQLKKLKISEKYLTQREKRVLKHKAEAEAALKKQQELMLREQEITKQEEEVNRIINQAMECFYQRKEAQKSRLSAPALDSLDVSSVVQVKTEQDKKSTKDSTSSVAEDLSDMVDHPTAKTSTVTQTPQVVSEIYGNESFETGNGSFETLEVTSQLHTAGTIPTAIISSTPRSNVDDQKATISDISDSLKMSDTLTETATTATSEASTDIEARIKVLKEQLKRRREEVKKSQQEQKRKKKAILKQKEEELKRKLQAVEVRATAMKEIPVVASSEGSADISESDMEERSKSKQEQAAELWSASKVDSEMHGYTPFSEVTPTRTEQATTLEASTALVVDTSQDPTTAVIATAVDESQLSAPPDEVQSDIIAKSSPASSLTSSTVSADHSSMLYTEEDIAGGESVITQLDDTLTKPLLPEHEGDQSLYSDQQPLDVQHKGDQLPPKDQHDSQKSVDQLPLDQVDEVVTKTVTTQYDETFESHDDTSIKTDDVDHTEGHDDHSNTLEQREVVSELDDQVQQTSSLQAQSVITQQDTSVKTQSVSSSKQLQSPVEAKLPLKASEVELSDSQPATEVSEASSIVESHEVLSIEQDISSFKIGERVLIGQKMTGTIQFVGQTMFAPGTWIGVELDFPKGTNDGSLDGVRYFTCEPSHGLFAPPNKVEIQPVATGDAAAVTDTPPVEPGKVRDISPVNTGVSSSKTASDGDTDEVIQPSVNETDRVEDISTGLVKRLSDEAVDEITAIWSNRPTTAVAVQKASDTVSSQDAIASKVTDELFALLLRSEVEMMCKINDKKETKIKTPTKLKLTSKPVDHSPVVTPPSPFHLETKIPTAEELSHLRSLAVDPSHVDSPPRQHQTARVMAGDISPPHSPPLSPIATNVRPLSESRSSSVESITQLLESHPVDTSRFLIPNDRETVNNIVASAWNACHQLTTEELHSEDIPAPSEVTQLLEMTSNLSEEEKHCVLAYQELVFELGVEVIKELRPCQHKPRPVWMPPQPETLSRDPVNMERVQSIVFTRLMKGQLPFSLPAARYIHGGRRVCGREIDFVEALLIKELRAEEKEWTNYDEDEELVKIQTADAILESLLTDTINIMNDVVSRKSTKSITA